MYKIKFEEHTLIILDSLCSFSFDSISKNKVLVHQFSHDGKLFSLIENIQSEKIKSHILLHSNPMEILELIKTKYSFVEAAGGLVLNEFNQILFIYRNKKWDLPKGKIESGEGKELAAIREVEEETGIKISLIKQHLITTYHTYTFNQKKILKSNHWYLMQADSKQLLVPQVEENIERVDWKDIAEISLLLDNSYEAIRDVINTYLKTNF